MLSEAFFLLGAAGQPALGALLERVVLVPFFDLSTDLAAVRTLLRRYRNVPMSLADACLVRVTEALAEPVLVTTDGDFEIYRRHSRHVIPTVMP